jgi:hypothetical protein
MSRRTIVDTIYIATAEAGPLTSTSGAFSVNGADQVYIVCDVTAISGGAPTLLIRAEGNCKQKVPGRADTPWFPLQFDWTKKRSATGVGTVSINQDGLLSNGAVAVAAGECYTGKIWDIGCDQIRVLKTVGGTSNWTGTVTFYATMQS